MTKLHYLPMRDLLLVQPPQRGLLNGFANGLIDLANFVQRRMPTAHIRIEDLALTSQTALHELVREVTRGFDKRLVVGITTTTASYQAALVTARAFKAVVPDCLVVFGGHHATPQHEIVLRRHKKIVDAVARGEGEWALLALVRGANLEGVPGLSFLQGDRLIWNPPAPRLSESELNELPISFNNETFHSAAGKFDHATYVSARGCPLSCAFCAVSGTPTTAKSIECVLNDLRHLVVDRGYRKIAIEDNFFAQNKSRTLGLCEGIAKLRKEPGLEFGWDCQTRVESMSQTVLEAFEAAGCEAAYLGVESLIEEELEFLNKTTKPRVYLDRLDDVISRMALSTVGCFMNLQVGLPNETDAHREMRRMRLARLGRIAARNGRYITVFPQLHVVYPGTHHFSVAVNNADFGDNGRSPAVFEIFTEWEGTEEPILRFLGENFAHGVGGIPTGILDKSRLRDGAFSVREDTVSKVRTHLSELEALDGIRLFKYGEHIVKMERSVGDAKRQTGERA